MANETTDHSGIFDQTSAAIPAALEPAPTAAIGPKPAGLYKMLSTRIKRAMNERMITVQLIEDLRDNRITISTFKFEKFTIVELEFMHCHYHGLTSCNPHDEPNAMEAVGRAFARALNELFAKRRFGDLNRVRILDTGENVCSITPEMFLAMVKGAD